jgi:hypothetical protein
MKRPIFVPPLTDAERQHLEAGLRSSDAFVLRRCQILLASARGELPPQIAHHLGCDGETVRNAIKAFHQSGLAALSQGSSRPPHYPRRFSWREGRTIEGLVGPESPYLR